MFGKMIAKGPKVGRLFPLLLYPSPISNYIACNVVQCDNQVWHRRLGHPNSYALQVLLKFGFLGNKNLTFLIMILLIVHLANLVKAKCFIFHCIKPAPPNLLKSSILMYGVLHL